MSIKLRCVCTWEGNVRDSLAGSKVRCPECRGVLVVPAVACPADPAALPKSPRLSKAPPPIPTVDPFAQLSDLA
jgi:hypothetical protein